MTVDSDGWDTMTVDTLGLWMKFKKEEKTKQNFIHAQGIISSTTLSGIHLVHKE